MTNFGKWVLTEASYPGNMGIMEMIEFYKKASNKEVKQMEQAAKKKDWDAFRQIIKDVIGVELV
jgi:hypothetical protein